MSCSGNSKSNCILTIITFNKQYLQKEKLKDQITLLKLHIDLSEVRTGKFLFIYLYQQNAVPNINQIASLKNYKK